MSPFTSPSKSTGRHKKVNRDTILGICNSSVRKLARRGGITRFNSSVYTTVREVLEQRIRNLLQPAVDRATRQGRSTITTYDILWATKFVPGVTMYEIYSGYPNIPFHPPAPAPAPAPPCEDKPQASSGPHGLSTPVPEPRSSEFADDEAHTELSEASTVADEAELNRYVLEKVLWIAEWRDKVALAIMKTGMVVNEK